MDPGQGDHLPGSALYVNADHSFSVLFGGGGAGGLMNKS